MLQWNASYATGHRAIDQQHERLFAFLNKLEAKARADTEAPIAPQDLSFLQTYVAVHFASEELCMFQNICDKAPQNQAAHTAFRAKIATLVEAHERGAVPVPALDVVRFLELWIHNHILGVDISLRECEDLTDRSR